MLYNVLLDNEYFQNEIVYFSLSKLGPILSVFLSFWLSSKSSRNYRFATNPLNFLCLAARIVSSMKYDVKTIYVICRHSCHVAARWVENRAAIVPNILVARLHRQMLAFLNQRDLSWLGWISMLLLVVFFNNIYNNYKSNNINQ